MTAIAYEAADAATPSSAEAQAAALWTFIHLRTPRFASADALEVVKELAAIPNDDVKTIAKKLKTAMAVKGFSLKHTHALDAAARLLGHDSWHSGGSQSITKPLQLRSHFQGFDGPLATWGEAMQMFGDYCEGEISAGGMCLYHFRFAANSVSMDLPFTHSRDSFGRTMPLMQVQWAPQDRKQLAAAVAGVETLRRRLEESGRGLVNGLAATQFCIQTPHSEPVFEDPLNSELVVVDMTPGAGYLEEISRGDEVKCWADLEELFEQGMAFAADGNYWVSASRRLEWSLCTVRAAAPAPQILSRSLTADETARLLRRHRNAVRFERSFIREDRVKPMEALRVDALGVDVDWERVDLETARTRFDRRELQETFGVRSGRTSKMSTEEFAKLVDLLDGPNPSELIRKPKRSELVRLDNNRVLRTFVSRIQDVVYEVPRRMDDAVVKAVDEAVNMMLTALRFDVETTDGLTIEGFPRSGPYLIYANQGKELLAKLEELGLVAYAGITTSVSRLRVGEYLNAKSQPLRFDRVLLLDIEFAEHAQRIKNTPLEPSNRGEGETQ